MENCVGQEKKYQRDNLIQQALSYDSQVEKAHKQVSQRGKSAHANYNK